jgi:hypothetical protein
LLLPSLLLLPTLARHLFTAAIATPPLLSLPPATLIVVVIALIFAHYSHC